MSFVIPSIIVGQKLAATFVTTAANAGLSYLAGPGEDANAVKNVSDIGISAFTGGAAGICSEEDLSAEVVGLNNTNKVEPIPIYNKAPADVVVENKSNARIVVGQDRDKSLASGYGGAGHSGAGAVDIVVGAGAQMGPRDGLYADPSFKADAARIYLSQKSDIDDYLDICDGSVGRSKSRSAIGMKADGIRLAARQGIKLVTGMDESNSLGGLLMSTNGIDLIAGNDDSDLQPIPKGENLAEAIRELKENLSDLNGVVMTFLTQQLIFNLAVQLHTHAGSFGNAPSIELQPIGVPVATQLISQVPTVWLNKANMMLYDFNLFISF